MKKQFYKSILGAAVLSLGISTTYADITWKVLCAQQGPTRDGSPIPAVRSNPLSAEVAQGVAATTGDFYSLGHRGYIVLEASEKFSAFTISEVTTNNPPCDNPYRETAEIYVSQGSGWVQLPDVCHDGAGMVALGGLEWALYVKIVDKTDNTPDPTPQPNDGVDFYDVDGLVGVEYSGQPQRICSATLQGKQWDGVTAVHPLRSVEARGRMFEGGFTAAQQANTNLRDGAYQLNFFSLGFGGEMCFTFDPVVVDLPGADLQIVETTWKNNGSNPNGCTQDYPEKAEIYVSDGGPWVLAGVQCKDYGSASGLPNGYFDLNASGLQFARFLKVVDITDKAAHIAGADGFDLDGIRVINEGGDAAFNPCQQAPPRRAFEGMNTFDAPVLSSGIPENMTSFQVVGSMVSDKLTVRYTVAEEGGQTIIIRDHTGREVLRQANTAEIWSDSEVTIPTSRLAAGVYFVTLQSQSYKEVVRFVKK